MHGLISKTADYSLTYWSSKLRLYVMTEGGWTGVTLYTFQGGDDTVRVENELFNQPGSSIEYLARDEWGLERPSSSEFADPFTTTRSKNYQLLLRSTSLSKRCTLLND